MKGTVMVVGAGIAGCTAAVELTSQGYKVILVEKKPSLGGRMSQLDKMFPTGDCGMCTILPKLLEITSNPNIQLMPYCEVKNVEGEPGDFKVTVLKKPRYVDWTKCNACTECFPACPVEGVPMEFNYGKTASKAISFYSPFPPKRALIDPDHCAYLKDGKCGDGEVPPCVEACKPEAILFEDEPAEVEVEVGAVVVATGLTAWHPEELPRYGLGKYDNVITGMDFERLLSGNGPTGGLVKKADGEAPKSVTFLQCVGPREDLKRGNTYCSAICCMAATMEAIGTLERDEDAQVTVIHNDIVAYGKNFQEQYRAAQDKGVAYVRGKVTEVSQRDDGALVVGYTGPEGEEQSLETEMLVLSTNLVPNEDNQELAEALGVGLDDHGFLAPVDPVYDPIATGKEGIYLAGSVIGPKDISESVANAAGASSMAASLLKDARGSDLVKAEKPPEMEVDPEAGPKIGVMFCRCGQNIAGFVEMEELMDYTRQLEDVEVVEDDLFACGGGKYKEMIKNNDIDRTVVVACTPKTHEHLFRLHGEAVGLNKYMMEMVNLRNQGTWVHMKERDALMDKARRLIRMGVAKARLIRPLQPLSSDVTKSAMVIGGGVSGLVAARRIGDMGYDVHLVDKAESLGGKTTEMNTALGSEKDPASFINSLAKEVEDHDRVTVHTGAEVTDIEGFIGQFEVTLKASPEETVPVGAIVVATGAQEYDPEGLYGYGKGGNVVTQTGLEKALRGGDLDLKDDGHVVMISCVGAKKDDPDNRETYCCNIGCANMLKNTKALLEAKPGARVTLLHQDWVLPHKDGERNRMEVEGMENVDMVRWEEDKEPTVTPDLKVSLVDADNGEAKEIEADMVVLTNALMAQESNQRLKEMLGVCLEPNDFFMGALGKLQPLDFTADGVFYCGSADSPKGLPESVAEGLGAASRVGTVISQESLVKEPTTSYVVDENCDGCAYCIDPCPYNALTLLEYAWEDQVKKTVQVNEAICKGCGVCMATCPKQGIYVRHFEPQMFLDMIDAAMEVDQ